MSVPTTPRQRWIQALRSGGYKQADGVLRNGDKFCCLGVACDLYAQDHPDAHWGDRLPFAEFYEDGESDGYNDLLPPAVRDWLGLRTYGARWFDGALSLAQMNDEGATFTEIADVIEREPKGLFA